ncbi:MAG: nitroreductase [Dehalococcoidales bacterium]|nr:nitroreductase [Dehalococcoidales bacterium]
MEVIEAIQSRRSTRGFKSKPVPRKVLEEILETCRWVPSAQNTQSWELTVLGGEVMKKVKARLAENIKNNVKTTSELPVPDLPQPYLQRATDHRDCTDAAQFPPGTPDLAEKRAEYWVKGGCFHDAPNGIIISMERCLYPKMVFDMGIMAQTICLAAMNFGLGTCITLRPVYWPDMLRELLGIPQSKLIVMAIAIGYPNPETLINNKPRPREPLSRFTNWQGF